MDLHLHAFARFETPRTSNRRRSKSLKASLASPLRWFVVEAWSLPGSDLDLLVRLAFGQLGTNLIMNLGADRRAEDSSVHCIRHRRFHLEPGFLK